MARLRYNVAQASRLKPNNTRVINYVRIWLLAYWINAQLTKLQLLHLFATPPAWAKTAEPIQP